MDPELLLEFKKETGITLIKQKLLQQKKYYKKKRKKGKKKRKKGN